VHYGARVAETAYAGCGELSLAYQVFGEGPVNVVFAGSFVSHVEVMWTSPEIKAFFDRMGAFARVVIFDKAGVGLSDPVPKVRTLEERVREIEAVMDAAGFEQAALMGLSEGGPAAIMFAASRPDRVQSLVLMGTFAWTDVDGWDEVEGGPAAFRQRSLERRGETYAVSDLQVEGVVNFLRAVRERWGKGEALAYLLPSVRSTQQLGMLERMSASPGMARATVEAAFSIDISAVLPTINTRTLVIHARDDCVPIQLGRYLAAHIPGARMLEIEGRDHAPWMTEPERVVAEVEEFLTGTHAPVQPRRALRTVLFTDIVASTQRAADLGDERWRAVLEAHDALTRASVARFGGRVVKSMGDGHLAVLDGPAQAIFCAKALRSSAQGLEIAVRAGIHTGECELLGDDIGGLAVHIGARVAAHAGAGEILVSSTVRDLVVGSGTAFEDRGMHELKGVPGEWRLLAISPEGAPSGSTEGTLAALPTPSPRAMMRPSDRALAAVARRAPGVLRTMARLSPRSSEIQRS
jgi:pimeloyl-ACP methyl ester carboxylesterase